MKKFFLLFIIFCYSLFAQNINLKLIKTESERFPFFNSALQVYDNYDEPIIDLKPENLKITLSGKYADSIKITTYKQSGLGIKVVLCIDVSRTMVGKPFEAMKNAVYRYIDVLRSSDRLAIYTFGDDVQMVSDFSNDKQYLKNIIEKIQADGNYTELYSALYKAVKKLADDKEKEGKIVVVISDGKDESKTKIYSDADVINLAKENGITIFSIGYSKIDKIFLQSLEKISDNTNGKYYYSPNEDELDKQYNKLHYQIQNIYLLNYIFYNFAGDGNVHNHTITVIKNSITKSISNKVLIPGGVAPISKSEELISSGNDYLIYFIAGSIFVIIIVVLSFVLFKRKKKNNEISDKPQNINGDFKNLVEPTIGTSNENNNNKTSSDDETSILPPTGPGIITTIGTEINPGRLEFKLGVLAGKNITINQNNFKIGRKKDNHFVISDETVSGYHAEIHFINNQYIIEDKNSTNGTFVNGVKVSKQQLLSGDAVKIGSNEGYFLI